MPFRHPFAAYNAASNLEAHLVCGLLEDAGIESAVVEDHSQAGLWLGGTLPEIHKPQVWIDQSDIERARPVLTDYDRRNSERLHALSGQSAEAVCDQCGQRSTFPATQRGTVQICAHCRAYVDVESDVGLESGET